MKRLFALAVASIVLTGAGCAQFTDSQIAAARIADQKYRCELITSNHQYSCLGLVPWRGSLGV